MPIDRSFAKCVIRGCKTRKAVDRPIQFEHEGEWINLNAGYCGWYKADDAYSRFVKTYELYCPNHWSGLKWTRLNGTVNTEKVCDGRCMGAIGPSCDCSCGGENHGKNSSVLVGEFI